MKKLLQTLSILTCISFSAYAQNVNIPDANFKALLIANTSINTDADKKNISVQEATAFTGTIDAGYAGISSLLGIEAFVNITILSCQANQLTSLDVSKNTKLAVLYCNANKLTHLDVSNLPGLNYFKCSDNQLSCIRALNAQFKNNWIKDASASYSETCTVGVEDDIINAPKTLAKIYNLQGQEVHRHYSGLVIYQYTDGSTEKVIQE